MKRINRIYDHDVIFAGAGNSVLLTGPVIFRLIQDHLPPVNTSLMVVIDDPDQDEFVQEFAQVDPYGRWSFISGEAMPLPKGHSIVYWAEVPKFPNRSELQAVRS